MKWIFFIIEIGLGDCFFAYFFWARVAAAITTAIASSSLMLFEVGTDMSTVSA
jgi:hypothetical protein